MTSRLRSILRSVGHSLPRRRGGKALQLGRLRGNSNSSKKQQCGRPLSDSMAVTRDLPTPPTPPPSEEQPSTVVAAPAVVDDDDEDRQVKCVVVGDSAVGKSSLLVRYTADYFVFNSQEMPAGPVFDSHTGHPVSVNVANSRYSLILFDTFSQKERETTRVACYPGTDVCLICFSVVHPASLRSVETAWLPEVRRHLPKTPLILVGLQTDLRDDLTVMQGLHKSRELPVAAEEGERVARRIKAKCYMECSALTMKGIDQVFDRAILRAIRKRAKAKYTVAKRMSRIFGRFRKKSPPKATQMTEPS